METGRGRFVVTDLPVSRAGAQRLYEKLYCVRGEMENRINEQQVGLFADRASTADVARQPAAPEPRKRR